MKLAAGVVYENYEDFTKVFDEYCTKSFELYTLVKSEKKVDNNVKLKHFKCIKHQDPNKVKSRSNGIRICKFNANSCPAELRVSWFNCHFLKQQ